MISRMDPSAPDGSRRLSAIVFSDIVGYSKMMGEDEAAALRVVGDHNELLVPIIQRYRGRILKFIGDAIMSSFDSASDAVLCGVEIQRVVGERNKTVRETNRFKLRIGIHIGDVTEKGGDIFGDGVNIAARIQPLADPGGICISQTVYDIVRARREIRMVSLGPRELKNIKETVHIYKVDVGEVDAPSTGHKARWALVGGGGVAAAAAAFWFGTKQPAQLVQAPPAPAVTAAQPAAPMAPAPSVLEAAKPAEPPAAPEPKARGKVAAGQAPARAYSSPHLELAWRRYVENQPEMAMDAVSKEPKDSPGAARAHELMGLIYDLQRRYLDAAPEYAAAAEAYGDAEAALYCRLLRYIDLKRAGRDAEADLKTLKGSRWPMPLVRLFLGTADEAGLLKKAKRAQRPAASYYLGMHSLLQLEAAPGGEKRAREWLKNAQRHFQDAAGPGAEGTVEFQRAKFELARMRARGDL